MPKEAGTDQFQVLEQFFIECGKLNEKEASIYILSLKKGQLSVSIVEDELEIDPKPAKKIFRHLETLGYLKARNPPPLNHRGGSGNKLIYIPCSPSTILEKEKAKLSEMKIICDQLDEHLESLNSLPQNDGEGSIYVQRDHDVGIKDLIGIISNAKQSIMMAGRDCSVLEEPDFIPTINSIVTKNIAVSVITSDKDVLANTSKPNGIKIVHNDCVLMPFVIVDNTHIMIAYKPNHPTPKYQYIMSTNQYLIKKFSNIFWHLYKDGGGEINA